MNYNNIYGNDNNNNNNQDYCSSGCESGWTLYLDHSSASPYASNCNEDINDYTDGRRTNRSFTSRFKGGGEEEEIEDEDMSMVSDASSGPPQRAYNNNVDYFNDSLRNYHMEDVSLAAGKSALNRQKRKETRQRRKVKDPLLDDTASSSLMESSTTKSFTMPTSQQSPAGNLMEEYSQGYSATTHFEVRPQCYDFYPSSLSGNQLQHNQW